MLDLKDCVLLCFALRLLLLENQLICAQQWWIVCAAVSQTCLQAASALRGLTDSRSGWQSSPWADSELKTSEDGHCWPPMAPCAHPPPSPSSPSVERSADPPTVSADPSAVPSGTECFPQPENSLGRFDSRVHRTRTAATVAQTLEDPWKDHLKSPGLTRLEGYSGRWHRSSVAPAACSSPLRLQLPVIPQELKDQRDRFSSSLLVADITLKVNDLNCDATPPFVHNRLVFCRRLQRSGTACDSGREPSASKFSFQRTNAAAAAAIINGSSTSQPS